MKKKLLLWLLAFLITAATAVYQRMTGPTYPISESKKIGNTEISYRLLRSENVGIPLRVEINVGSSNASGFVHWKRFKSFDNWTINTMKFSNGFLQAELPSQPPAGKLEYFIEIKLTDKTITIPDEHVVARYKGSVPTVILILHVIAMFGAMLLSTRTGLEYFNKKSEVSKLTLWTIGFLFAGGLILGPVVQKYAFDAYWTGWPFGNDLTDNKTAVALIGWVVAFFRYRKSTNPKAWALFAAILLLVVYLIPHSVLGSEIDYTKTK